MEKSDVTIAVSADKPVPGRLQPLLAFWMVPEADATRVLIAKASHKGMTVFFERSYPRGPVGLDAVETWQVMLMDNLYERLLAFVGIQPPLADLPGDAPAAH